MRSKRDAVETEQQDGDVITLRYFDTPVCCGYRSRKLPLAQGGG
ncbi:MAG: hypothetical protein ACP5HU_09205 [Phycisphaerae bacterium]